MHFTYRHPEGDLRQGDLLEKTEQLVSILERYHPYYSKHKDYKSLMVLTQSCDLERRRDKSCKSKYITLAAVRSADIALKRELERYQFSSAERAYDICSKNRRKGMKDFLQKLHNNNVPDYFFLAADPGIKLNEDYVAFLALSVAIKADKHYEVCERARFAQLKEVFQAKLGWLVGHVYSRVGTPDWVPASCSQEEFDHLLDKKLDDLCLWPEENAIKQIKKLHRQRESNSEDPIPENMIRDIIREFADEKQSKRDKIIDIFIRQLVNVLPDVEQEVWEKLEYRLKNNPDFVRLV